MKLGIVTDSTCDLPQYLIEQNELEVVPCILILEGKEYVAGRGLSREGVYQRLPSLQTPPTTAAPSIGDFSARYESLLTRGCDHILSIHAASALTTIINSAKQASAGFLNRVTTLDSFSLSLGLGFQVLAAAEASEDVLEAALAGVESTRVPTYHSSAFVSSVILFKRRWLERHVAPLDPKVAADANARRSSASGNAKPNPQPSIRQLSFPVVPNRDAALSTLVSAPEGASEVVLCNVHRTFYDVLKVTRLVRS